MANKYVVIAAGGTGGHVIPAVTLAKELKQRNNNVEYITDLRGVKYLNTAEKNQYTFLTLLKLHNSNGTLVSKLALLSSILFYSLLLSVRFLFKRPSVLISFGGYPCAAPTIAAFIARVPVIIYEQNSVIGKTNKLLLFTANRIAASFPNIKIQKKYEKKLNLVVPPIRDEFSSVHNMKETEKFVITIIGGSQGSSLFSKVIPGAIDLLNNKDKLKIFHQARKGDISAVRSMYEKLNIDADVEEFFNDVGKTIVQSDLIIARAGASSLAEILFLKKPSILIPMAKSADNHQLINAKYFADNQAAILIEEKNLNIEMLAKTIINLMQDKRLYEKMVNNLAYLKDGQAQKTLKSLIKEVIND